MAEIRKLLQHLSAMTRYTVRVRAINEFGVFSGWSEALDFTTGNDQSTPSPPTGLTIDFHTPSLVVSWAPVQLNTDGTSMMDLRTYEVTFTVAGVSVIHETISPYFVLTFAQNRVDFGSPQPEMLVAVRAVDVAGNRSSALTGVATNEVPSTPTAPPLAVTGFTLVNVTIPAQPDVADLDGFDIYHSTTSTFTNSTLLASTANGVDTYAHAVGQGTTHYYRYKTRDVFSQVSPDFSPVASTTTFSALIEDTIPPDDVTNFRVTDNGLDADQLAYIELAWNFNTDSDLASYELRYRRAGDSVFSSVLMGIGTTSYRLSGLATGTDYHFQIRAFDISSNASNWVPVEELVVTTLADEEAPAAPTGLVITPGIRTLILQWEANTEFDFEHYDVHVGTDTGFVPSADNLYSSPGPGTVESVARAWDGSNWVDLLPDHTYYLRTYAYDRSGNKSDPSAEVSATTRFVTVADIAAESITADRIATSTLLAALTISGSIKTATGGARMEMNSSGLVGYANDGTSHNFEYLNDEAGVVIANQGFVKSDNYVAGVSGWYFGAGSGDGLLEINDGVIKGKALQIGVSTENLVVNSSFENYPASGSDVGLAREWGEYPSNGRSPFIHTWTPGTGSDVAGPNFLYQSKSQRLTVVGSPISAGLMQQIGLGTTPLAAGTTATASVWIKLGPGVGPRLGWVAFKNVTGNKTYRASVPVSLNDGGWHRVVVTAVLNQPAETVEIHCFITSADGSLQEGDVCYFEGAQVELSSYVSTYHPATLEIPDNYIQSAYIAGLTADRIKAGVISSELIQINGTGYIQSFGYSEASGLEAGYRLSVDGITFENGSIDVKSAGGAVQLNGEGLQATYPVPGSDPPELKTQLKVDSTGIFIGGSSAIAADLYVDTANDRTVLQSAQGGYSFVVDTKPDPGENKALRLYETASGIDSFYLTYAGLGYFAKGVIGTAGAGGNRIHNASFETTKGVVSSGTSGLDHWSSYSTGTGTVAVSQAGSATAIPVHGAFSSQLIWSTNTGRKGILQAPAVETLTGASTWAATTVWTLSFGLSHLGTPQLPTIGFDVGGIAVTPVLVPPAAAGWQQYVYLITVGATPKTDSIRIYFTGATGNAIIDAVQLERGEIASLFNLMPEEMQWAVAPPMGIGDTLQSSNYVANSDGWKINGDGNVEFNSITMRGTLIANGGGGHLVELGQDVGPGSNHYGLSLSHVDFNNIFLRRNDGVIFFRVNSGGANSLTFDSTSGQLAIKGNITATGGSLGSLAVTGTLTGGTISGATITGTNISATSTISGSAINGSAITGGTIDIGTHVTNRGFIVGTDGELHARSNLAVGWGYSGGVYVHNGSGNTDTNWGYQFNSGGPSMLIRAYMNGDGERRITLFNTNNNMNQFYIRCPNINGNFTETWSRTAIGIESDRKVKREIQDVVPAGEKIMDKMRLVKGRKYKLKDSGDDGRVHVGFVADELAPIFPEVLIDGAEVDESFHEDEGATPSPDAVTPLQGIVYTEMIPLLVEALKELDVRLDTLEKKNK